MLVMTYLLGKLTYLLGKLGKLVAQGFKLAALCNKFVKYLG